MKTRSYILTFVYTFAVIVPFVLLFWTCYWFYYSLLPSFSASFRRSSPPSSQTSSVVGFSDSLAVFFGRKSDVAPGASSKGKNQQSQSPGSSAPSSAIGESYRTFRSKVSRYSIAYPSALEVTEEGSSAIFSDKDGNEIFSVVYMTLPPTMIPLEVSGKSGHLFDDYVRRAGIDEMGYHSLQRDIGFATVSGMPCHFTVWGIDAEGKTASSLVYCYGDSSHVYQAFVFSQAYSKDFMNVVLSFKREE